jgi:hypothetical protein
MNYVVCPTALNTGVKISAEGNRECWGAHIKKRAEDYTLIPQTLVIRQMRKGLKRSDQESREIKRIWNG